MPNMTAARKQLRKYKSTARRWCTFAPYGYRFTGRPGFARLVCDQSEREVAKKIMDMRTSGSSWYAIARELLISGVRTAAGAEYSVARVRRLHHAAMTGSLVALDHLVPLGKAAVEREGRRHRSGMTERQRGLLAMWKLVSKAFRQAQREGGNPVAHDFLSHSK